MRVNTQRYRVAPVECVGGELTVPGDKSISHRAVMLGAVAEGTSTVNGFLEGEDCLATLAACRALGVAIDTSDGRVTIEGRGFAGLKPPDAPLDFGNSGTGLRLMTGLLAAADFDVELTGDESLKRRPMRRIIDPLAAMGATVGSSDGKPPLKIEGGASLHGIDYSLAVASAQVKSSLLLAALSAAGRTTLRSPGPSRDHTERMLVAMGAHLEQDAESGVIAIEGPTTLAPVELEIPGDFSSAAFFIVAGCLGAEDGLLIKNVGINPTRTGLLTVLAAMGADIAVENSRTVGVEPVADLYVKKSRLHGIEVPPELVPLAIDEFPILFVAAAAASGRTIVRGAAELRHKECDRLAVMATALCALGGSAAELPDGLIVDGGRLRSGRIDSHGDHRVAMALAVAALACDDAIEITNTDQVSTSFPGFVETAVLAGIDIALIDDQRP